MADKIRVGGILFYSICQDYRYTICLASANEMKVNNQHYVGAVYIFLNANICGLNSTKKEGKCLLNLTFLTFLTFSVDS